MKRIILTVGVAALLMVGGVAASAVASSADKPPAPPGQGECEHGNSQKPCKDDPQPTHGQDCDEHGPKNGGQNEDHCKTETTTEETTTEETTTQETTTSGTTTEETVTTSTPQQSVPATTVTETTASSSPSAPAAGSSKPTGTGSSEPGVTRKSLEKQLQKQAPATPRSTVRASGSSATVRANELPYTGLPLGAWVALGLGLVGSGIGLRRRFSRKPKQLYPLDFNPMRRR